MKHLPNNIRVLRSQAGMTQRELADKLGVDQQAIARWESGRVVPRLEAVTALATLFTVSVGDLVTLKASYKLVWEPDFTVQQPPVAKPDIARLI